MMRFFATEIDDAPAPAFSARADEFQGKPLTQETAVAIGLLISEIEREIQARGSGFVSSDECVALLKLRGYQRQLAERSALPLAEWAAITANREPDAGDWPPVE